MAAVPTVGVTIYGCEGEEAALFHETALRLGVRPTITEAALSEATVDLATGSRCISVSHKTPVSNGTLLALGRAGVEYVSTRSVGLDHIDVSYAGRIGITVETVAYSPDGVADYTLMLMLMAIRNAASVIGRAAVHDYRLSDVRGKELRDLTVGVVGTGRIGAAVVDRLWGFGCRVLACDHRPKTSAEHVSLDELIRRSDVVTLHTPLTEGTRHLLNREQIARLKDGAFLVNTGRGALVDTDALVTALENGRLGGAALDVVEGDEEVFYRDFGNEPVPDGPLARLHRLPNVIVSPHTAYYTDRALHDVVENSIRNCLAFERDEDAWPG